MFRKVSVWFMNVLLLFCYLCGVCILICNVMFKGIKDEMEMNINKFIEKFFVGRKFLDIVFCFWK